MTVVAVGCFCRSQVRAVEIHDHDSTMSAAGRQVELAVVQVTATALFAESAPAANLLTMWHMHDRGAQKKLAAERSAVGRGRVLREWLAEHREDVARLWPQLGFPAATLAPTSSW